MLSVLVSTHSPTTRRSEAEVAPITALVDGRTSELGFRPLSDQAWADLVHGAATTVISVRVTDAVAANDADGSLAGYAQATAGPDASASWTIETVLGGAPDRMSAVGRLLLDETIAAVSAAGGREVNWLVQGPTDLHEELAAAHGLKAGRRLHQMRRPLPTGIPFEIETRAFDPTRDIAEWVRVNSRAFAWNPEQGGWTEDNVRSRLAEPWFDADGFLIHERSDADGTARMAGFCWTKVHDATAASPPLGEIYVIAVDPDFHGLGLGRALTLAGLDSLARRGVTTGMLFVDADNTAAVRLYDTLGFTIHRTDCLYTGHVGE